MKRLIAVVAVAALALIAFNTGCENKQQEPPVAQTPEPPAKPAPYPTDQIPEPPAAAANPEPKPAPEPALTETPAPNEDVTTIQPERAPKAKAKSSAKPKEKYAAPAKGGRTYVVRKGDTLQEISQKFYGTTKNWRKIADANKGVVKDPNRVPVGTKLVIP